MRILSTVFLILSLALVGCGDDASTAESDAQQVEQADVQDVLEATDAASGDGEAVSPTDTVSDPTGDTTAVEEDVTEAVEEDAAEAVEEDAVEAVEESDTSEGDTASEEQSDA